MRLRHGLALAFGLKQGFALPSIPEPRMENQHGNATAFSRFYADQY